MSLDLKDCSIPTMYPQAQPTAEEKNIITALHVLGLPALAVGDTPITCITKLSKAVILLAQRVVELQSKAGIDLNHRAKEESAYALENWKRE